MPIAAQCNACGRRLRVPSMYAGRRVTCTKCGAAVPVGSQPMADEAPVEKKAAPPTPPAPVASPLPEPRSRSDQLGAIAMALGLLSILILCLPYVGYGAIILSALGLFLGIAALLGVFAKSLRQRMLLSGSRSVSSLSITAVGYPCGGTVTCLIALLLALAPHLLHR